MTAGYALFDGAGSIETPDHASLDITGNFDIRALVLPDNWDDSQGIWSKLGFPGNSYDFGLSPPGRNLAVSFKTTTSDDLQLQTSSGLGVDGQPLWVRVSVDLTSVPATARGTFYTSDTPVCAAPSWSEHSTNDAGSLGTIVPNNEPAAIGTSTSYGGFVGRIYALEFRNEADVVVANPDFRTDAQMTGDSPTRFTDGTGKEWTFVNGAVWVPGDCNPMGGSGAILKPPR